MTLRRRRAKAWRTRGLTIRDEVARVARDERDRIEMRVIREQLAELAPRRPPQTSNSA
jgi:hypothetical protein